MLQKNGRGRTSSKCDNLWRRCKWLTPKITAMLQKSYTIWNSQQIPVKSRIKLPAWSPVAGFSELLTVSSICIHLCTQILSQLADLKENHSIWLALDGWNMMEFMVFFGGNCWTKGHISRELEFCCATFIRDPESWRPGAWISCLQIGYIWIYLACLPVLSGICSFNRMIPKHPFQVHHGM